MPVSELRIELPFPGFYETALGESPVSEAEQIAEHEGSDFDALLDGFDYAGWRQAVGIAATGVIESWIRRIRPGYTGSLTFAEIVSPKEYNFSTDSLYATAPPDLAVMLLNQGAGEGYATLARHIERVGTEQPGYMPLVSPDLTDWLAEPVTEWSPARLGLLLHATFSLEFTESYQEDLFSEIEEACQELPNKFMPLLSDDD